MRRILAQAIIPAIVLTSASIGCTPVTPTRADLIDINQQQQAEIDRLRRQNDELLKRIDLLLAENERLRREDPQPTGGTVHDLIEQLIYGPDGPPRSAFELRR